MKVILSGLGLFSAVGHQYAEEKNPNLKIDYMANEIEMPLSLKTETPGLVEILKETKQRETDREDSTEAAG
ncbi:MAG: hypothetical protein ABL958_10230 [Bdellovibrionia bacterium]